jgi:hypothetical protein
LLGKGEDGDGPGAPGPEHEGPFPGPHWPDLHTVEYLSKLIILIVLLLALPWLVGKLLTDPGEVLSHAAAPSVAANSMGA